MSHTCHNETSGAFRRRNKVILGWVLSKTLVFTFSRLSVSGSSGLFLKTSVLSCLIILISFAKNPYHVVKLWLNFPQVTGLENVTVAFFAWVQELSKLVHFSIWLKTKLRNGAVFNRPIIFFAELCCLTADAQVHLFIITGRQTLGTFLRIWHRRKWI